MPLQLTWFYMNPNMDNQLHPWNDISIPKLHSGATVEVWEWISNTYHTLLDVLLYIHAGIQVYVEKWGSRSTVFPESLIVNDT